MARREAPPTLRVRRSTRSEARLSRVVGWCMGEGRRPELRHWSRCSARLFYIGSPFIRAARLDEKRRRLLGCAARREARLDSLGSLAGGGARAEGPSYAAGGAARLVETPLVEKRGSTDLGCFLGFCGGTLIMKSAADEKRRRLLRCEARPEARLASLGGSAGGVARLDLIKVL